ncbi:Putative protein of unknown function [Podospora comata]|uniref:Uncharacterized protein n=1 Tax=Podospora comata TaxID=48703 RepID=A0ABY6RV60_PODCO|nr:Putative protein of unknown function [Podospora comata]
MFIIVLTAERCEPELWVDVGEVQPSGLGWNGTRVLVMAGKPPICGRKMRRRTAYGYSQSSRATRVTNCRQGDDGCEDVDMPSCNCYEQVGVKSVTTERRTDLKIEQRIRCLVSKVGKIDAHQSRTAEHQVALLGGQGSGTTTLSAVGVAFCPSLLRSSACVLGSLGMPRR